MKPLARRSLRWLPLLAVVSAPLWTACAENGEGEAPPPSAATAGPTDRAVADAGAQPAAPVVPATATSAAPATASAVLATAKPDSAAPAAADTGSAAAAGAKSDAAKASSGTYRSGEDPEFAAKMGWPVKTPPLMPGALLPAKRIVAYYGNPLSKRMGVLGEYPVDEMLRRFDRQVDEWRRADPTHPVVPAMHLIAVVAQGAPGPSGDYRSIVRDSLVEQVYGWAKRKDGILFIDIQVGQSRLQDLLPRFEQFLKRPDVHLAIDPEFSMHYGAAGRVPGSKIGQMTAADVNYASGYLAELVRKYHLPPKVLVVHRFTRLMLKDAEDIRLRPEVQVVMNMDGWGAPWLKRDSYKDYIVRHPVEYTGFKIFYHNDTKKGDPLLTPAEVLRLRPQPLYIQYQ